MRIFENLMHHSQHLKTYIFILVSKSLNGFTCTTGKCKTSRNPSTGEHYYYCWIHGNFPNNWDYCTPKHNSETY